MIRIISYRDGMSKSSNWITNIWTSTEHEEGIKRGSLRTAKYSNTYIEHSHICTKPSRTRMKVSITAAMLCFALTSQSVSSTTVEYCSGTSLAGKCFSASPSDGTCGEALPFGILDAQLSIVLIVNVDLSVNDQTHSAEITDGNCVFWANADCDGDHTDQLDGTVDDFNTICGGGWQKRISSFKCCAGDSSATWCAGNKPACA
ncbi:hypothetical protein F5878DRAFT_107023 [Lentinula raphanica]|uniref:Uncharacterized protein n=1 Tax=Lentinula raphanica TaxID=153919 RepID=A0AA38PK78_9AGAR|nr:hypothetical protein F5878DRAFT_107023 [Lentinula raphanica]